MTDTFSYDGVSLAPSNQTYLERPRIDQLLEKVCRYRLYIPLIAVPQRFA